MHPSSSLRSNWTASALTVAALLGYSTAVAAQSAMTNPDAQIASALQAAPPADRDKAKVLGWRDDGTLVTLREGSSTLICLSDDPTRDGWSVACYPESIEPYMARGRALRAAGVTDGQQVLKQRWDEADAGTLEMPDDPATVYILHGDGFDAASGEVISPFLRWAIYTPWATAESTGLPIQPTGPGAPWIMFPGTPGAHMMITPGRDGG